MNARASEPPGNSLDRAAKRLNLYAGALLSLAGVISLVSIAATSTVRKSTADVRAEILSTRGEMRELARTQARRDSLEAARFDQTLAVVELAVVALVEPSGSPEQRSAVAELRRRRHVTPRLVEE